MFKSIFNLSAIFLLAILSIASQCKKDNDTTPDDGPEYTSLLGYWKLKSGVSYAKKEDGTTITTATLNPGTFAHEFFADGKYTGHDLTGNIPSESGTWKLEVKTLDGKDIEEGTLSVTTPSTQALAGEIFVDADGSQKFEIASINSPSSGSKPIITLTTKKYEAYPYAENWAVYVYEKQ